MNRFAEKFKFTLVGKFTNTLPKIKFIWKIIVNQAQLSRGVNITNFNLINVYIDLDNEFDYNTVWTTQNIIVEGKLIMIRKWTPTF